jgi:hypothetical protein
MTYLELLIYLLKTLNSDESLNTLSDSEFHSNPLISAVKYLADICLIDNDGNPNSDNINEVSKNGFPIYPGEKDRFGWLTGCIDIKDKTIVFG